MGGRVQNTCRRCWDGVGMARRRRGLLAKAVIGEAGPIVKVQGLKVHQSMGNRVGGCRGVVG